MIDWLYLFFSTTPTQADINKQWVACKNLNHHFDILAKMEAMLEDLTERVKPLITRTWILWNVQD